MTDKVNHKDYIGGNFINSLLNDSNGIASSYIIWKKRKELNGSMNFYVNKMPFDDDFLIVAGIDEIVGLIQNFKFDERDLQFLKNKMPYLDSEFLDYLHKINLDEIVIYGFDNGTRLDSINIPIISITGPLVILNLLNFPITNLIGFSSLVSTNAVRMKIASEADKNMNLIEMGLRRAQGPLAGLIASKYCYLSFDGVSNVLSGSLYNIPTLGTMAHAYIMSYKGMNEDNFKNNHDSFFLLCLEIRKNLGFIHTNISELYAFASFSSVYKDSSVLLVDTYDTLESGIKNTIIVAIALKKLKNFSIKGVRLDSGDLAELSKKSKILFKKYSEVSGVEELENIIISASNDINEKSIKMFNSQGHSINTYGIGTHLATCQRQPFLILDQKIFVDDLHNVKLSMEENKMKLLVKDNEYYNETDLSVSKKLTTLHIEDLKKQKNLTKV